jgi:hypothetical protein
MAKFVDVGSIGSYFESLSDPRHTRNRKHLLVDIAVIAVCGILCGCEGPTAIHRWAALQADWLIQYLTLPNGIPSRDCIRRLLLALKPEAFQRCFQIGSPTQSQLTTATRSESSPSTARRIVVRMTCERPRRPAHRRLGQREGIALGQVATDAKSNEITAIPQLLEQINLVDTIITIDAMGCQKNIVEQFRTAAACRAVKDNQPTQGCNRKLLRRTLGTRLEIPLSLGETNDTGHGRKDDRTYFLPSRRDFGPKVGHGSRRRLCLLRLTT